MLGFRDLFHLPQVDALLDQLVAGPPGLVVVAGQDAAGSPEDNSFMPSGRTGIFRILMRQILVGRSQPGVPARAVVVAASRQSVRVSRQMLPQVEWALVIPPASYPRRIAHAARSGPDLLVVDRLDAETASAALEAAISGVMVLAQLETVFNGVGVAYHLMELGAPRELLCGLAWIITVRRLPTLCPDCKQHDSPGPALLAELRRRYPNAPLDGPFFRAAGCARCHETGREGSVTAFDILRVQDPAALFAQPSQSPIQEYILRLAALGLVSLDDVAGCDVWQLRRVHRMLTASERALAESKAALERKLAQLQAANQVLEQRTGALISLQGISQTLVTLTQVDEVAARVCRYTRELCGADRAILYFLQPDGTAEILAAEGWEAGLIHQSVEAMLVMGAGGPAAASAGPAPFAGAPPGVLLAASQAINLKTGLRVPLIAQHEVVGLMIIHSTRKSSFAPGEAAMLQAFANQAAVALQRAGLIEALRDKIAQLQDAQAGLVKKERLERELELARQVQQRLLPQMFPLAPGYAFAARCEPARQVGGDFYDVISLDADRFGVVIADVSDKGMPAALFMALTRSLLLAEARRERSPRAVLINVHQLLLALGQTSMFVTVFYGVVDVTTRQLTYARAGHDRPLLLRRGAAQALSGEGTFLGIFEADELRLSEEKIALAPGDRLALYTDGLVDALGPDEQPFGLARLTALLQAHAHLSAEELCSAAFAELAAYQGASGQYDDMTMLVVEVKDE